MNERVVNINLIHHAGLAGMESAICSALGIKNHGYHDDIIYATMIQAGVQRFRVAGSLPQKIKDSNFLRPRVEEGSFEDIHRLMSSVQKSLAREIGGEDERDIFALVWFLTELIHSLQTRSSMVSILRMPNVKDYADKISPAAFFSLSNLFRNLETINLNLPVTQLKLPAKDVEIFHEIISSDIFCSYVKSQAMLECSLENQESVGAEIMNRGRSLYNKFNSALDIKKASLSLIPITSSLIDNVCGKLPGKVANILGDALSGALNEKRRITIYNYGDTHQRLLVEYYKAQKVDR